MNELLPCPWCHRSIAYTAQFQPNEWQVLCDDDVGGCGAFGPIVKTEAEAVAVWNRRGLLAADEGKTP